VKIRGVIEGFYGPPATCVCSTALRAASTRPSPTPAVFNEGYLSVPVQPSPIPLRSMLPRRDDCQRLLVPVCLSASHVAFGSVRMEPTLMLLGEAADAAAALAAPSGSAVQDVDVEELQESLRATGQVLAP
jgi:hypothetical protein